MDGFEIPGFWFSSLQLSSYPALTHPFNTRSVRCWPGQDSATASLAPGGRTWNPPHLPIFWTNGSDVSPPGFSWDFFFKKPFNKGLQKKNVWLNATLRNCLLSDLGNIDIGHIVRLKMWQLHTSNIGLRWWQKCWKNLAKSLQLQASLPWHMVALWPGLHRYPERLDASHGRPPTSGQRRFPGFFFVWRVAAFWNGNIDASRSRATRRIHKHMDIWFIYIYYIYMYICIHTYIYIYIRK